MSDKVLRVVHWLAQLLLWLVTLGVGVNFAFRPGQLSQNAGIVMIVVTGVVACVVAYRYRINRIRRDRAVMGQIVRCASCGWTGSLARWAEGDRMRETVRRRGESRDGQVVSVEYTSGPGCPHCHSDRYTLEPEAEPKAQLPFRPKQAFLRLGVLAGGLLVLVAVVVAFDNGKITTPTPVPTSTPRRTPTKPPPSPTAFPTPRPSSTSTMVQPTASPTRTVPSAGLISWWSADSTTQDKVGSNNGKPVGNLAFAPGVVGQAFKLDGATAYIRVEDTPSLDLSDSSFTVAAWINPSVAGDGAYHWVLDKSRDNSNLDFGFGLHTDGRLRVASRNLAIDFSSPLPITANISTHIVVVQDAGLGQIRLYVNGDMVASARVAGVAVTNDAPVVIGARQTETSVAHLFNGLIDEVLIFDRALSSEEIRTLASR